MEKMSPAKPDDEESPSTLDGTLIADSAAEVERVPTLQDIHMEMDAEEDEQPLPEKMLEKTPEKKKEGPSSAEKKKTKETPATFSSKRTTADSSHTESAHTDTKAVEEKEVSEEGSSGDSLGEDEDEVNDQPEEEDDDDVEFLAEQPAKKARTATRSSKRGKGHTTSAKKLAKNK